MTTETETSSREEKFFGVTTSIDEMLPKNDPDPEKDEIIIEQVEDDAIPEVTAKPVGTQGKDEEDDIENYSEKVQKRINKLTWQAKEAERVQGTLQSERDEAFRVAKALHGQSQQQAQIISTGEARLVQEIKDKATLAIEQARSQYASAYKEGNTEEILKAQEAMITAKYYNETAMKYSNDYENRVRSWTAQQQQRREQPQQQYQPQPQQQQAKQPTAESNDWATRNPWFGKNEHRDMTAIAYATHETMIRDEGIKPDSPEYYERLDATMKLRFPEFFTEGQGTEQSHSTTVKPHAVVAPATRNTGAKTRKVKLNASQRSLAKAIGITEEQYALQLLKEKNRG